jgi:hypothetical protein
MRGNVYRPGRRRTGSFLLAAVAGMALGLAMILASVSSAYAKAPAATGRANQARTPSVVVIAVTHRAAVKAPPIARVAGHKIA